MANTAVAVSKKATYRVWRLGLGSKYYDGREGIPVKSGDQEVLQKCLQDGIFPFHVGHRRNPANYSDIESFQRADVSADNPEQGGASSWRRDLWTIYNLIRPGDRVVLAKTRKEEGTVYVYAAGTVTRSPHYKSGEDPFGYRIDVLWDKNFDQPINAKEMSQGSAFFKDITDDEVQLKSCREYDRLFEIMPNKNHSLNLILCGPPGTGKTYSTKRIACEICSGAAPKDLDSLNKEYEKLTASNVPFVEFVTFHPSYDYADFIEGYKPTPQGAFVVVPGVLKRMAQRAASNDKKNYVLIIDEINRGNISKIFGETITLLEEDKRVGGDFPIALRIPTSPGETFSLPPNLYVLGTMNTADRSISMLDVALRRRFDFEEVLPNPDLLADTLPKTADEGSLSQRNLLRNLNRDLEAKLESRDHQIGHAWFDMSKEPTLDSVTNRFLRKVMPLLLEWFYEPDQRDVLFKEVLRGAISRDLLGKPKEADKLRKQVSTALFKISQAELPKQP